MVETTGVTIKIGGFTDIGKIWHARHRTKRKNNNKGIQHRKFKKKMRNTDLTKARVIPGACYVPTD